MIRINIIPKELKRAIELKAVYDSLQRFISVTGFFVVLFVVLFGASYIYLEMHLADVTLQSANLNKNTENYSNRVSEINTKLSYIEQVQKENIKWIDFLSDFSSQVNDGISIKSLSSSKSSGVLNIVGAAKTRDDLLGFEKNLKSLSYLSDINIPLKTLLEKEEIEFDMQVKINLYEFAVK